MRECVQYLCHACGSPAPSTLHDHQARRSFAIPRARGCWKRASTVACAEHHSRDACCASRPPRELSPSSSSPSGIDSSASTRHALHLLLSRLCGQMGSLQCTDAAFDWVLLGGTRRAVGGVDPTSPSAPCVMALAVAPSCRGLLLTHSPEGEPTLSHTLLRPRLETCFFAGALGWADAAAFALRPSRPTPGAPSSSSSSPSGIDSSASERHSLHRLLRRWCWQMLAPPHSLRGTMREETAPVS